MAPPSTRKPAQQHANTSRPSRHVPSANLSETKTKPPCQPREGPSTRMTSPPDNLPAPCPQVAPAPSEHQTSSPRTRGFGTPEAPVPPGPCVSTGADACVDAAALRSVGPGLDVGPANGLHQGTGIGRRGDTAFVACAVILTCQSCQLRVARGIIMKRARRDTRASAPTAPPHPIPLPTRQHPPTNTPHDGRA